MQFSSLSPEFRARAADRTEDFAEIRHGSHPRLDLDKRTEAEEARWESERENSRTRCGVQGNCAGKRAPDQIGHRIGSLARCAASLARVKGFCSTATGRMASALANVDGSVFAVTKMASMP